jgi:hypothetical protein
LQGLGLSLAFSTYRANRLIFLGTAEPTDGSVDGNPDPDQPAPAPQLKLHERLFDRPMGLFVAGESLWMATRCQLWRLDNLLGPGQLHEGGDRLYVPAVSYTTGDVNAHEVVLGADGQPIFVNTAFSCLAALAPLCSFAPTWASACGGSGEPSAWRNSCAGGGVLIPIPTGELGWIDDDHFHSLCALPGFNRAELPGQRPQRHLCRSPRQHRRLPEQSRRHPFPQRRQAFLHQSHRDPLIAVTQPLRSLISPSSATAASAFTGGCCPPTTGKPPRRLVLVGGRG